MALGLGLLNFARTCVARKVPWTFAVHALKQLGMAYKHVDFADQYAVLWGNRVKNEGLKALGMGIIPTLEHIQSKYLKTFDRYQIHGVVNVWNNETGKMIQYHQWLVSDFLGTKAEMNQWVVDEYWRLYEKYKELGMPLPIGLVTGVEIEEIIHNEGFSI